MRERDALIPAAGRASEAAWPKGEAARPALDGVEIEMALGHVGEPLEPRGEVLMLAPAPGRDAARAERAPRRAGSSPGPEYRAPRWRLPTSFRCRSLPTRLSTTPAIRTSGSCEAKPAQQSGGRLRLPGDVDHQQHRQAEPRGEVCRRSAPAGAPGMPSNRPMAPSMTRRSACAAPSRTSASSSEGGIAQLSRLKLGRPVAAAWKRGRYSRARPWPPARQARAAAAPPPAPASPWSCRRPSGGPR